jgi:hypothetical protein
MLQSKRWWEKMITRTEKEKSQDHGVKKKKKIVFPWVGAKTSRQAQLSWGKTGHNPANSASLGQW